MRSDFFAIGGLVAGAVVLWLYFSPPIAPPVKDWFAEKLAPDSEPPILVVIVGSSENVEIMRQAVGRDRILVDTPHSFALDEGRVIAASLEVVGESVTGAGWVSRPLEIVGELRRRPEVTRAPHAQSQAEGAGGAGFQGIPVMTQAQALRMLDHLR